MCRVVASIVVVAIGFTGAVISESTCRHEVQGSCRIGTQHSMLQKNIAHSVASLPIDEGGSRHVEKLSDLLKAPLRGTDGGLIGVTREADSAGTYRQIVKSLGTDKAEKKRHAAVKQVPTEVTSSTHQHSSRKISRTPVSQDHNMRKRNGIKRDPTEVSFQYGRKTQNLPKLPASQGQEVRKQDHIKRVPAEVLSSSHANADQLSERVAIARDRSQATSASPTKRFSNHGTQRVQHEAKNKKARLAHDTSRKELAKSQARVAAPSRHGLDRHSRREMENDENEDISERETLEKGQRRHAKHGARKVDSLRHQNEGSDDSKRGGDDSIAHSSKIASEDLRKAEKIEHATRESDDEDEIAEERDRDVNEYEKDSGDSEGSTKMSWAEKQNNVVNQPSIQELASLANSLAREFIGGAETGDQPYDFKDELEEEQEILQDRDREDIASETEEVDEDSRKKPIRSTQATKDRRSKDEKSDQDVDESGSSKASKNQ